MSENEIKALISELNRIEVKGEQNIDILNGCFKFLRVKLQEFKKPMVETPAPAKGEEKNG